MEKVKIPASLDRVVGRFIQAFAPEKIILYGSYAKGTNHARSDMDLLVIAETTGMFARPQARARHLARDSFPPVDVVFTTPLELAEATPENNPFLLSILEYGIVVYEK
jgi:predicted nucleotidyltransferase